MLIHRGEKLRKNAPVLAVQRVRVVYTHAMLCSEPEQSSVGSTGAFVTFTADFADRSVLGSSSWEQSPNRWPVSLL